MSRERNSLGGWAQIRRTAREMREGTWLTNAQSRSRASKTAWDALVFPVSFAIWLGLWWIGVRLGIAVLHVLKPSITAVLIGFGGAPMTLVGIVILLSPVMASIAFALWLANGIVYSIPQAKRAQTAKARVGAIGLKEAQSGLVAVAVFGLAMYVLLLAIAILIT